MQYIAEPITLPFALKERRTSISCSPTARARNTQWTIKDDPFFLQNSEAKLGTRITWWGRGNYTTDLDAAQVFTQEEAVARHQERESFIPWPVEFVYPKAHAAVDCQYVREQDLTILPPDTPCYVQLESRWDGNDLFWETADGAFDANLDRAQAFTLAEALTQNGGIDRAYCRTIWPKSYIDGKARKVAHQLEMSIIDALEGTDIALIQRRVIKTRHTCCGCRRFFPNSSSGTSVRTAARQTGLEKLGGILACGTAQAKENGRN